MDLSNEYAPYIYIDIDNYLFNFKEQSRKILGLNFPLPSKKFINQQFLNITRSINRSSRFNLVLFSTELNEEQAKLVEEEIYHVVPYMALEIYTPEDLRKIDALYIFSNNEEVLSRISQQRAFHVTMIGEKLNV